MKNRILFFLTLAVFTGICRLAIASSDFYVSVYQQKVAPFTDEMLRVTTDPFGGSVVTEPVGINVITNGLGGAVLELDPDGTLYGVSSTGFYVINPATAERFKIYDNSLPNTSGGLPVQFKCAAISANGTIYGSDTLKLYTIDSTNGTCTTIGTLTAPIYALAFSPNGTLYGAGFTLYTINLANAQETHVGTEIVFGSTAGPVTPSDIAFGSDGNLYMLGSDIPNGTSDPNYDQPATTKLYIVGTTTGLIGAIGSLPYAVGIAPIMTESTFPKPTILNDPVSQTVTVGDTAAFSVAASGIGLNYQWYFNNGIYFGTTNSTLSITNVATTNGGNYFVVVTNFGGSVTSSVAVLTVNVNANTNPPVVGSILASTGTSGNHPFAIVSLATDPLSVTKLSGNSSSVFFTSMSFSPDGQLFGAAAQLYRVNTNTWMVSTIGDMHTNGGPANFLLTGMAFSPSGVLFGASSGALYTINTNTAEATLVGTFPSVYIWGNCFCAGWNLVWWGIQPLQNQSRQRVH